MQVCDLEPQGSAPWELLRKYGGKFGLFEKIKMGGVGSPKIKYISGLPEVDEFVEETAGNDIPHLNFEFLKNGLLARINKTQYLKGVMIAYDEITSINLSISEKLLSQGNIFEELEKTNIKSAELIIESLHGETLTCEVSTQAYMNLKKYFQKNRILQNKFHLEILK
jgi:hypothetical protein